MKTKRLSEKEIEKTKELKNSGMSISEIAEIMGVSPETVRYHTSQEHKERKRHYRKLYDRRKSKRYTDKEFKMFKKIILHFDRGEEIPYFYYDYKNNIYVLLIRTMCITYRKNLDPTFKQIKDRMKQSFNIKDVDERLKKYKIKWVKELGLIEYNRNNRRYHLSEKGKKLCMYLFE